MLGPTAVELGVHPAVRFPELQRQPPTSQRREPDSVGVAENTRKFLSPCLCGIKEWCATVNTPTALSSTRGVLAESTSHTIGVSTCSIICFLRNCFLLLFFSPLLGGVLAFLVVSYRSPMASVLILARHTLSEVDPALMGLIYVSWTAFCIYLLYLVHSLGIAQIPFEQNLVPKMVAVEC
ncbi:hypothetical protein B0H10DRAFT_2194095 [Mycena sp. CBHHK59/15]|nr:hypothetical protein B0H10DRAFT_2194095 [Mycena sp. CBHHK59/15]